MSAHPTPLKYLGTAWFSVVMGLTGLSLAWHRASWLMDDMADAAAWTLASLAAAVFALLVGASVARARRHPQAWTEDLHHPVRHPFVAAIPVSLLLLATAAVGPWPERLRPAAFILIAPPAVVGLALLQLGAPVGVAWALWGMAVFCLVWAATQMKAIASQPFGVPHWAMSFPLAAVTALTLRLAQDNSVLVAPAMALLALTTLVLAALTLGTLRGLRDGSLLAPEPVAMIQPVAA